MSANDRSVRIGPISLFTLIAVLCLATLAVLSIATANASYNMAVLQGSSMGQQYAAEKAAQSLVASIDGQAKAASGSAAERAQAIASQLETTTAAIQQQAEGVTVSARVDGASVNAELTSQNERVLDISIALHDDGSYAIEKWNMTAKQNEAESGNLWSGI